MKTTRDLLRKWRRNKKSKEYIGRETRLEGKGGGERGETVQLLSPVFAN